MCITGEVEALQTELADRQQELDQLLSKKKESYADGFGIIP
jgi:hypothetical protein